MEVQQLTRDHNVKLKKDIEKLQRYHEVNYESDSSGGLSYLDDEYYSNQEPLIPEEELWANCTDSSLTSSMKRCIQNRQQSKPIVEQPLYCNGLEEAGQKEEEQISIEVLEDDPLHPPTENNQPITSHLSIIPSLDVEDGENINEDDGETKSMWSWFLSCVCCDYF